LRISNETLEYMFWWIRAKNERDDPNLGVECEEFDIDGRLFRLSLELVETEEYSCDLDEVEEGNAEKIPINNP